MVILDVNIVNLALPTIQIELHTTLSTLQWIIDAYTLSFACLLLTAGYLGLRIGVRNIYLLGLVLFILTSIACGVASTDIKLIFWRLLQGMSAALVVPSSLTLVHDLYEDLSEQTKAIALWASIGGLAAAVAPILGALILVMLGWRYIFFINIPLGLIAINFTVRCLRIQDNSEKIAKYDIYGQITGIISITALTFILIELGKIDYQIGLIFYLTFIFISALFIFLIVEYKALVPIFPIFFFKSKIFFVSILIGIIINLCGYGILFLLPLFFHNIKMYSTLMCGLALTPFGALAALGSFFAGKIANKLGHKIAMMFGLAMASIGFFVLVAINTDTSYWLLFLPLIFIGAGGAITMPAITIAVLHSVSKENTSIAAGILNTSRQIGSLMGVALFGTITNVAENFIYGLHYSTALAGIISLIGFLGALIFI